MTRSFIAFALKACLVLVGFIGIVGQAAAQPPTASESCNVELTIDMPGAHLEHGQLFRFVGPVGPQEYIIVTPLPGGAPHTVGPGDHLATLVSKTAGDPDGLPWRYEWAAPVSTTKHNPVRLHLYDMYVRELEREPRPNIKCMSLVEFDGPCHTEDEPCDDPNEDPGHATAN